MATWLKQSTSVDVPVGPFLDETDGKTAETGLTITQPDVRLKKNNGNWAQKAAAQTLTHEEAGWYEVTLDATDTNTLGVLVVAIHESGALPVWREFMVVPANVWDSYLGADFLQVDTQQIAGGGAAAAINAEVVDALNVDTYPEPGQGAPPATNSIAGKIGYLAKTWRNKLTMSLTGDLKVYNDAGDTVDQKATSIADDGTTFTRTEIGSGP